jgi:GH18 family chitinase
MVMILSITHYLTSGVAPSKIRVGIPYYGHTWYNDDAGDTWKTWGATAKVQGQCCGPFKSTYGGKFGKGCQQCGTMMYSETQAAKPQNKYFDPVTHSDIAYFTSKGADGYTDKGIWLSYNSVQSVKDITQYAVDKGLAGVFIFDTSMDSMSGGEFTYELSKAIAGVLGK